MEKKNPFIVSVASRIRKRRELLGFSQEGFADTVGLDRRNYGAIERGHRQISITTLARIGYYLDIHPAEFLEDFDTIKRLIKKSGFII